MRRVLRGDGGRKLGEGTFGRDRVMGDRRGGDGLSGKGRRRMEEERRARVERERMVNMSSNALEEQHSMYGGVQEGYEHVEEEQW